MANGGRLIPKTSTRAATVRRAWTPLALPMLIAERPNKSAKRQREFDARPVVVRNDEAAVSGQDPFPASGGDAVVADCNVVPGGAFVDRVGDTAEAAVVGRKDPKRPVDREIVGSGEGVGHE